MQEKTPKVTNTTASLMVSTAFVFDVFQVIINIIPVFGLIFSMLISITAFLTFFIWFLLKGVSFTNPKRVMYLGVGFFIEILPLLNILPSWTLTVALVIHNANKEKKLQKSDIIKK